MCVFLKKGENLDTFIYLLLFCFCLIFLGGVDLLFFHTTIQKQNKWAFSTLFGSFYHSKEILKVHKELLN